MADEATPSYGSPLDALNASLEPEPAAQQATPEGQTPAPEVDAGTTAQADSFTKLDPNALPEDLQPYYKAMQADYTRKTQEIADQRKQFESLGVEPTQAAEAVQFMNALQTDPNFAVQVHQALSAQLQQQGYGFADAQAMAAQQMTGMAQDPQAQPGFEDFGSDPRDVMLTDMYNRMNQFEQQQQMAGYAAEVQRAEMAVRQAHPDYTDADVNRVYELAFAHNGDLLAADRAYQAWKSDVVAGYLNQKATSVPPSPPASTGSAQQPTEIPDIRTAGRAAREYFLNALQNG